jgi:hypothetical protein
MVGGSLRVLRLLPPLKLVAMILLKYCVKTPKINQSIMETLTLEDMIRVLLILEAQPTEPVSLTIHSALRKLNTEPPIGASHQVLVIWLSSYREEDI